MEEKQASGCRKNRLIIRLLNLGEANLTRSSNFRLNFRFFCCLYFSSPNIAKPLHAGHMRSTFLGNFLSNIHLKLGRQVKKINYLGDWGTQYGMLAVGFKKYGSYEKLKSFPIKHLLDVYSLLDEI